MQNIKKYNLIIILKEWYMFSICGKGGESKHVNKQKKGTSWTLPGSAWAGWPRPRAAGIVSGEGSLPGVWMAVSSLRAHMASPRCAHGGKELKSSVLSVLVRTLIL